jgi:two-component sensor histidine kinase
VSIYARKQTWKLYLVVAAACIVGITIWQTNNIAKKIADEEREKVKIWAQAIRQKARIVKYTNTIFEKIKSEEEKRISIWAEATKRVLATESDDDRNFYINIISSNKSIPVILTDNNGKLNSWLNIDGVNARGVFELSNNERRILDNEIAFMKMQHKPLVLPYYGKLNMYLYYKNSKVFTELKNVLDDLLKSFMNEVVNNSASAPVIVSDETKKNILFEGGLKHQTNEKKMNHTLLIQAMAKENVPIEIDLGNGKKNYIFYETSYILKQLQYYPYLQLAIISLFLLIAYILFSTARKSEQNQVWLGLAKETAHQLGTPLSSLIGWVEWLRLKEMNTEADEIEKDVKRLETITERFSKIGSQPILEKANMFEILNYSVDYMRKRTTSKIEYSLFGDKDIEAAINIQLFEWVIENLTRNAIDAILAPGKIIIELTELEDQIFIDFTDTGKGIAKNDFKTIFKPGYTTKKRGWGLGLSLAKRIIEDYHKGKIYIKQSEINKGTTFRILLRK